MKSIYSYACALLAAAAAFASATPQNGFSPQTVRVQASFGVDGARQAAIPLNGEFKSLRVSEPGSIGFAARVPNGVFCTAFNEGQLLGEIPLSFNAITGVECVERDGSNGGAGQNAPASPPAGGDENVRITASFGFDTTIQREIPINGRRERLTISEPGSISFFDGIRPPPGTVCSVFDGGNAVGDVPTSFRRVTDIVCGR